MQNTPTSVSGEAKQPSSRLLSLDALRGFDMFWIVGAEGLVHGLKRISDTGASQFLADQMSHKEWAGFAFYDLIFPLFVFIVGVSLVFSLGKRLESEGPYSACWRLFRRAAVLYLLGLFYYGGLGTPYEKIRLMGVLQRIAISYFFAGLVFAFFKTRGQILACLGLLVGYWALMTFVPVPGFGAGDFQEGHNLANWVDKEYLPLRKWNGDHDPEGLLSNLPAIATCLLGVLAGQFLRNPSIPSEKKAVRLLGAGVGLVVLGWLWHLQFPVIKKVWTSSFVLVAGGYSCLLLAVFYQVIDVWHYQKWAQPFVWIGMNPITIYLAHALIPFESIAHRFVGGDLIKNFGRYDELITSFIVLAMVFALCRFLYRKGIFLRV